MNTRAIAVIVALSLSSLTGYSYSQNRDLLEYTAEYQASANGLAATAIRRLSRMDESAYRLSNSLEAKLAGQTLARLEQASEFTLRGDLVVPLNYSYQLSGVSRASQAISFNWDAGVALSTEDDESWQLQLVDGVMDPLSYQVAIRKALTDGDDTVNFSFEIIDGDEIQTHRYRRVGEELLTTPLGELNTLKLERVRETSDERATEIWLATDWDYLLTRIDQVNGSGLRITLELESAELNGNDVRATP